MKQFAVEQLSAPSKVFVRLKKEKGLCEIQVLQEVQEKTIPQSYRNCK